MRRKNSILTSACRVLIATFSPWQNGERLSINGNVEPMLDFFTPRVSETVLIDQVYPGSDQVLPRIEMYEKNRLTSVTTSSGWVAWLTPLLWVSNKEGTRLVFKIRDFLSVIDWCMRSNRTYDFFIGFEAINALAGIIMKRLGKIKNVIYYVSDYSPHRYRNPFMNWLYLWLDRMAAMHADIIWDVSPSMQPARIFSGLVEKKSAPVIRVPNALYPAHIGQLPEKEIEMHSLVFLGTLGEENGPGLAVEAISLLTHEFPDIRLHIIGGPLTEVERLREKVCLWHLEKYVMLHGFMSNRKNIYTMIRHFAVALAPYRAIPGSVRWYGDATKIRSYMAAGLPTVTTQVPPLGKEIAAARAGLIVSDTADGIASGVRRIFRNKTLFRSMRRSAIAFAKNNTWDKEFTRAFGVMNSCC